MGAVLDPPRVKIHRSNKRYMPGKRITPRQQQFADLLASGLSLTEASKQSGYKSKTSAWEASKNPHVQQYLATVQSQIRATIGHTVQMAMQEAAEVIAFAKEHDNPMAFCKAVELRAKLSGLLIDRVEVFSMDLKGALDQAKQRVVNITPVLPQVTQATE